MSHALTRTARSSGVAARADVNHAGGPRWSRSSIDAGWYRSHAPRAVRRAPRSASGARARRRRRRLAGEAPVDLPSHDLAVADGVVVAAQQGAVEVGASALEAFDVGVEDGEAAAGDRLPVLDALGGEDPG